MRVAVLLAALVLLSLAPAADAQSPDIRAQVRLATPFSEELEVTLAADGPTWTQLPDGRIVELDPGEEYRYTMRVARPALAFLVVRAAEILPLNVASTTPRAPDGWTGVASSDVLAFGQGLRVDARLAGAARVRLATVGEPTAEDVALATKGVGFLAAQHEEAPDDVLIVRAPPAAIEAPIVANATVALSDAALSDELARLLARAHQRYRVVEIPPASAAWFREGEERLQEQTALLAAGLRTSAEVDESFLRARAVADPESRLPQAPAGSTLARQKGLVVVRALDVELRNASGGRVGLADLLAELDGTSARLDSAAIEEAAVRLAGERLAAFFARYVYGTDWPATPGVRDAADVFVTALAPAAPEADAGDPLGVRYVVVNRGTQPSELDLVLRVDGAPARTIPVHLDVGERAEDSATIALAEPGDHLLALGPLEASVHVRGPAALRLVRATSAPDAPVAGEAFTLLAYVENAGETTGRARIEVYEGDALVQRTTEAFIDGGSVDAITLAMRVDEPGLHAFEVRLVGETVDDALAHLVEVRAPPVQETPLAATVATMAIALAAWIASRPARSR